MKTTIDELNILWKKLGNDTGVDVVISTLEGYILDIMDKLEELFDLSPKSRVLQKGDMYPDWIPTAYEEIPRYELVIIQTLLEMMDRPTRSL